PGLLEHAPQGHEVLVHVGRRPSLLAHEGAQPYRVLVPQPLPRLARAGRAGVTGDEAGDPVEAALHGAPGLGALQAVEIGLVRIAERPGRGVPLRYGGDVHRQGSYYESTM